MQRSAEISSESWTAARQPRARHVIVTKLRKLVLEFSATPLSVLRVYPDTLTVERVLSIEFINCARRPRPALPLRLAPSARSARLPFSRVPAAWRIRSAPAAGALRTRGRRDAPLPGRAPALATSTPRSAQTTRAYRT